MRTRRSGRTTALIAALVLAAGTSACTGEKDDPEPKGSPPPSAEPAPLATTVRIGEVTGRLAKPARAEVRDEVAAVVDQWFDDAFVGGEFPRTDFASAYDAFTPGAAKLAKRDGALTSNAKIGDGLESVEATARVIRVDLLAVNRKATAATARIRLDFTTTGATAGAESVRGRLSLVRRGGQWRIFAYDVTRAPMAPAETASTPNPTADNTNQEGDR